MKIEESTYGRVITEMISQGYFNEEEYTKYQALLMDEFVFMNLLFDDKDICKLYELLRAKSNVFNRMLFCFQFGYNPDRIKPHTIRESLKNILEV
jgi:hypothetical protein